MPETKREAPNDTKLVFAAYNTHSANCGPPPGHRNSANPRLYYGYYENRYGEQFVFTYDPASQTGTIEGGDLEWGNIKTFTLGLLKQALHATQALAAQIEAGRTPETPELPVIDAALALGRLTGLTSKDEVLWLRACLEACGVLATLSTSRP
jgi:hypothetical protein